LFAISYGIAKFFGGVASDVVVGRQLFCGGLLLAGIATATTHTVLTSHQHLYQILSKLEDIRIFRSYEGVDVS
jgi:sugar phosphate permease